MEAKTSPVALRNAGARRLDPAGELLWSGEHGALHCEVDVETWGEFARSLFRRSGIQAFSSRSATRIRKAVSVKLGVIEDPSQLDMDSRALSMASLERH